MTGNDIKAGQTLTTKMRARFSAHNSTLAPISIINNTDGFIIFEHEKFKQALPVKSFIDTYIKACKYKLST